MAFIRSSTIEGSRRFRYVRFLHQALFCLNLTFLISCLFLDREARIRVSWLDRLGYSAARHLDVSPHSWGAIRHERLFPLILFLLLWTLLASLCCLFSSMLFKVPGQERFLLRLLSGFVAVCSAPAFWYYFGGWSFITSWKEIAAAEVMTCTFLAILFLSAGSRFPAWLMALILPAHCIFWCWYYLNCFGIAILLAQPVVAFASGLAWACYVADQRPVTVEMDGR